MKDTQISAFISRDTKAELERLVRQKGLKKGFVVEQALQVHLQALRELPDDVIISPTIVLSKKAFARLIKRLKHPEPPTPELRKLMKGEPVSDDGLR